jgi:hypothetical protein
MCQFDGNITIKGDNVTYTRHIPSLNCTTESTDCRVVSYTHTVIHLTMPPGLGPDVEVRVFVQSVTNIVASLVPVVYAYGRPAITTVSPNPLDSRGGEVSIFGDNFGQLGLVGMIPPVVHINGMGSWGVTCIVFC